MSVIWQQRTHGVMKRQQKTNRSFALLFLTFVVVLSVLTAAYLGLVASNVRVSREIWALEHELLGIERKNQAVRVECARLGSIPVLQERSVALGYQPAQSLDYLDLRGQ